jgi:hypothetical protein
MDDSKKISEIQERIVSLYLRLNGYLQTGLIIHSKDWGDNYGEIDRLGVRFINHSQLERQIECDPNLKIGGENIDFVICEVKNKEITFNDSVKTSPKAQFSWHQIGSWSGLFNDNEIDGIVENGPSLVENTQTSISEYIVDSEQFGRIRLRPILFVFDSRGLQGRHGYLIVTGDQILDYIWECFDPEVRRETCSTTYPYTAWGTEFTDIVQYIKDRVKENKDRGTLDSLIKKLKV